ncbi:outer membrane lipoprotein chaperone LolA [candidate division WOR-3 bacterium]|nr:outer membrane lipoprotein chaperone LolA [candidate division WOR-3 bacterium]
MKTITFIFLLLSAAGSINAQDVDQVIEKTLAHYQNMESFYAEFEQTMCDEVQGICCTYTGKIYFLKPNFFRMEMDDPRQVYVGDSVSLWIYLPEKKHAIRQSLGEVPFQINPDHFLLNYSDRFIAAISNENNDSYEILLNPKRETDIYDHIMIVITKQDHKITAITICDQAGSENTFHFNKIEINKKISKKKFQFEPPGGTQVDEY